jgi:type I restriction enzyme S subunit
MSVPQLRFKDHDGRDYPEWDVKLISEVDIKVIDGDRGQNYPNGNDFSNDGYCLFLNAKNVTKSGFAFEELSFISKEKDIQLRKGKLSRKDLIITTRGSVGNIAYYSEQIKYENIRINSGMVILRNENPHILPNYLYHYFYSPKFSKSVQQIAFGSAQPQLTVLEIKKFVIGLPSIYEQTKIANFLTSVDEKISHLTKKCELLTQYKKGVMQKIFSQEIRFKDDEGREFSEWEVRPLGEVFKVTRGNVLSMSLVTPIPSEQNPYPVFSSQTKNNGLAGYYNTFLYENSITWTTDGANAGDVNYRDGKFYCTNVCGVLISNEGYANTCTAELINAVSKKYVSYVGNPKLMNNVMAKIEIDFPCVAEQTKVANFLTAINDKITNAQSQLAAVKQYKQGLLQQMFV